MSLVRSSLQSLAAQILGLGLAFLTSIVLARYLGPTNNGRYAILVTVVTLIQLVAGMGYPAAITYFGARRDVDSAGERLGKLASTSLVLALMSSTVVLVVFALVARSDRFGGFLERESLSPLVVWIAVASVVPYLVFQFMRQVLRSRRRISAFNGVTVLQVGATCALIWGALAAAGSNLTLAVAGYLAAALLAAGVAVGLVSRLAGLRLWFDRRLARKMTAFSLRSYAGTIFQFLSYKLDLLILTAIAGATEAGYYVVAVALAERLWDPTNAVRVGLQPHVTAASRERAIQVTARFCRALVVVVLTAAVALLALGRPLVELLFGSAYEPAVVALLLLIPGAAVFSSAKLLTALLAARGHPQIPSAIAGLGVAVNVPLNLALIPRWGIAGCAAASSITYALLSVVIVTVIARRYGIPVRELLVIRRDELSQYAAQARSWLRRLLSPRAAR